LRSHAFDTLQLSRDRVQFVHKPPKKKLVRLYQDADLFVFSSQTDTQGLVLAEAMAAGTPVVALDGPGQRDIIANGKNGFLVENADQMLQKIILIAQSPDEHVRMQKHARQTARKYDPKLMLEQLLGVYEQSAPL